MTNEREEKKLFLLLTWFGSDLDLVQECFFFHEDEWVSARITAVWSADLFAHELDVIICYSLR